MEEPQDKPPFPAAQAWNGFCQPAQVAFRGSNLNQ
jgi:hypothetical protein